MQGTWRLAIKVPYSLVQPKTNKLWFTDNGRDYLGDDTPPDKLNYTPNNSLDFGFPYYHGKDGRALSYLLFITGWQKNGKFWSRPVAPLVMPDGSLLVSDDYTGVVYRFSYQNSNH